MRIRTLTVGPITIGVALAVAFACSGAFTKPVFADERPPRYDLNGFCDRLAITPDGFSPESKATCMMAQGDALDAVRRVWPNTPVSIQDNCSFQANVDHNGDYQILEACIRAQTRQQQDNQGALPAPKAKAKPATPPK